MAQQKVTATPNLVFGKVMDKLQRPLPGLLVKIYDLDMRSEKILGEGFTDKNGAFQIPWFHKQLSGRGKKEADITVKVFSSEKKTLLYASDVEGARFNASEREEIDVIIEGAIEPETVEFDTLVKEVTFLANKVAIADLQENEKHRDVTFLSREMNIDSDKIEHLVIAHRLAAKSKIDAAFFYGLLRKNTLLKNDFVRPLEARLVIDINSDILILLYDAALAEDEAIQKDIASAVKEMIVPAELNKEWKKYAEQLKKYKAKAEEYYANEFPRKVLDLVSRFVLENKLDDMDRLLQENKDDLNAFLKKVTDDSFFGNGERAQEAKTSLALAELLGFDEQIIAQVKDIQKIKKPEEIRKLAALNKAEWKEVLNKSASKIDLAGKPMDKKLIDLHASSLARRMEKEFPTVAFSAQLGREKNNIYRNQPLIDEFLRKHEDFDLQRSNLDLFLKDKRLLTDKNTAMKEELKKVQRIFKLVPHYGKTNALLRENLYSSQNIAAVGENRFVREIAPKAGIDNVEAKEIFKKAERTSTAAMLIVGELQDTMRAMDLPVMETTSLALKLEAVSKDFPNLKSLFKLTDACACEHCRSVYSPAAYLVEILQFLDKRSVTDLTVTPHVTARIAKDVLLQRRPELAEIDLGCENANTPLPYIDLVCELLEEAVEPDPGVPYTGVLSDGADPLKGKISNALLSTLQSAGIPVTDQALIFETETSGGPPDTLPHYLRDKKAVCKIVHNSPGNYTVFRLRQTLSTTEELSAAPEYVNIAAYATLKNSAFAFKLPFDLDHTEAKAYLSRFDISIAELMEDFQVGGIPADEVIAAEKLKLTNRERQLIVSPDVPNQQSYWNTASTNASDELKIVDTFLNKTGLNYNELDQLLTFAFIDPADNLFIKHLDLSCDTEQKEIANLDEAALDRIHRFLRLQKKTGWKLDTWNEIISQSKLGNGKLDDGDDNGNGISNGNECLIKASELLSLWELTGIKLEELIGFYGQIPHQEAKEGLPPSLYYQVFLNKAKNGTIDEGLFPENIDGSQPLSNFKNSLSACLQLSAQEFDQLLILLPNTDLTFANLSYLFAASRLMRRLKLKTDGFVIMVKLTKINLQDSPEATVKFVEAVKDSQRFSLKAADAQFMLHHEASNLVDRELKDEKIKQLLEKLQADFQKSFTTNRSSFNSNLTADEQKEALQSLLAKLPELTEEEVKTFHGFIDRIWTSANDAKTFVTNKLSGLFDVSDINNKIDLLDAAPGPDLSAERKALLKAFVDSISAWQFKTQKEEILSQHLAKTFKSNTDQLTTILVDVKLKQPAPGTDLLRDLLLSDSLIDTDVTHTVPVLPAISSAAFAKQFQALRLLHKMIPMIKSFKLEDPEIDWFLKNNKGLNWLEWDAIPYQTGQLPVDYEKYAAFAKMLLLSKRYTPVADPADAEISVSFFTVMDLSLPGNTTTKSVWIEKFSLLTGYSKEDIDAVDAHLFVAFNTGNYHAASTWESVERCLEDLRKLGSTVQQVKEFIKPVLTGLDSQRLRMTLKSRYDENTWLSTLKEIMDSIRPQKRNALVAYLLSMNPDMKNSNDLYDYFLVDVEMESCMPSSRIVQAHGAIQLFVQRCLMGLEPKAAADVNNDKNWEQWKWMKNYRVWEANRKVFLYPENWIEPELRDDKSFIFKELENELIQNELTEFTAEQALINYLEKLDNLAFLEIVATWYQTDIRTMHVFGRTKGGDPAIYYYRRFEQERYWSPWEKVELDITSDHLLAFVRNNRLCLAWPVFSEEPDPNPQSTVPNSAPGTIVNNDKPKRKLKIQLAISEFANKKWLPKKISKGGMLTPYYFTTENLPRAQYNLLYMELTNQIWIFSTSYASHNEYHVLNGTFNIAGCKGYPELVFQGTQYFPDFLPDFRDTLLNTQRYHELNILPDDLAVRNGISFFNFYEILRQTPGFFRLTYPHQLTVIDIVAWLWQYLILKALGDKMRDRSLKMPLGTLLPYFKEDSRHAYVIIPGFYNHSREAIEQGLVKRTASNVMQLIEDVIELIKKIIRYQTNPTPELLAEIMADFQKIKDEVSVYKGLKYGEEFKNMYHPLICSLRKTLYKDGIGEFMKRETQLQRTSFDFEKHYNPNPNIVPKTYVLHEGGVNTLSYPVEDIDFTSDGSYSGYNWELFFHVPFLLATRLTKNLRFEEAQTWFHYMFNPTGALEGTTPQKYWVTKPFFLTNDSDYISQRIDTLLYNIADPTTPERAELEFAIDQWRKKPFKPDVVARFRPVAYQKALLMKYIDNLIEAGDHAFRQDTMESIVTATQYYIAADKLLGPKPRNIPSTVKAPYETYNQISARLDAFGNALIDLENILPDLSALPEEGEELPPPPITLSMLYFCIPQNDKMLAYWDRIADRLFKIRHCQNIDGIERSLALFAPPIDPGMLVRAAASGLDISSVLAGINAPLPHYRFHILSQKATELASEVRGLGTSLMMALEKKDAETFALLRSELEIKVLNSIRDMKLLQVEEAVQQIEVLKKAKVVTEERHKFHRDVKKIIDKEQLNLDKLEKANAYQDAANITYALGATLALIPDLALGASGFGGSPHGTAKFGGSLLAHSTDAVGKTLTIFSAMATYDATRAATLGGYERRFDNWKLEERLAQKELIHIDKQILASEIRKEIAEADLKSQELQVDNAKKSDDFMRSKFTNEELYDWMIGQISSVYFRAYQLAYDFAKKAERSYRFELGNGDTFIQYGYWDSLKKGLQSAEHLTHDIKRMESSYLDKNKREYEITKHISLEQLDPLALVRLRATGVCDFDIPEVLFDMDYAGHYFRRTKSISISLPCIAGPYTSVSARLSLISNRYRKNSNPDNSAATGYVEDPGNDERFVYNVGAIQSIATSNAQNDNGMFELNFKDDRYLPFEGTGAISSWRLELPNEVRQFDYNTISHAIIQMKYTSREGGSTLKSLAEDSLKDQLAAIKQQLSQTGLHMAIHMKHDLPNEWHLLKKNGTIDLTITKSRLPYMAQTIGATIENVMIIATIKNNPANFVVNVDGNAVNLSRNNELKLCIGNTTDIALDTSFELSVGQAQLNTLEDLIMMVKYSF